jgi:hypothetical protein
MAMVSTKQPFSGPFFNSDHRLFVIDGVISLPVAISGFFVLPDVPEISSPWYLSKDVCSYLAHNITREPNANVNFLIGS